MVLPSTHPSRSSPPAKENPRHNAPPIKDPKPPRHRLHRTYSWPPSISVIAQHESQKRPAGTQDPFNAQGLVEGLPQDLTKEELASSSSLSLKSSISGHSSTSSAPSAAEKAKGFRASVSKRWTQFVRKTGVLNRLAERAERRYHKKNERKIEERDITNPPHELSYAYMEEEPELERGRAPIFSATGQLRIHGGEPHVPRKCRTSSGRRHAWAEPSIGMFTVIEEQRSIDERERLHAASPSPPIQTRPTRMRATSKSTL